jgi:hypothetical protein
LKNIAAAAAILLSLAAVAHGQNRPAANQLTKPASRGVSKNAGRTRAESAKAVAGKPAASADGVDRLLELWDLAQGGAAALNKLSTRVTRGRIEMSDSPLTGSFEKYAKRPHKAMMVANTPRGQILDVADGARSWVQTPWGASVSTGYGDEVMARPSAGKGGPRWREYFSAAALKGRGYVDGREVIVLAATPHGRPPMLWHFDAGTGLLRKLEFANPVAGESGERLLGVYYDSYATVDGVKVPALFRQVYTNFTLTFRVTEVKHNVHIDDALFRSPEGK